MYDDVLIPTDGSRGAARAVEEAIELAAANDARLHALYVVEPIYWTEANTGQLLDALEEEGERATGEIVERATEAGVEATGTVRRGYPANEIIEYADEEGCDLIVMGTHGRRGLGRMLLGSVTERVVRLAEIPVLTVRMTEEEEE